VNAEGFTVQKENDAYLVSMLVEGLRCGGCITQIESALKHQPGILDARLHFSTKRLNIHWQGEPEQVDHWVALLRAMGYRPMPFDAPLQESQQRSEEKFLLRCLAVAGFASGNLMLFSIPLWTTDASEMGVSTRSFFLWLQALIALPAIAYSGRPFLRSAWEALRQHRTNMDVPITLAVILASAMSLFETVTHGAHAYFDSAIMLLFFLLIGRFLEARARGQARNAAGSLVQMMRGTATVLTPEGKQQVLTLRELEAGMTLLVATGEKIGADGVVTEGSSQIDTSLITGETLPQPVAEGSSVFAGTLNQSAPLKIQVIKASEHSLLAEIVRLMEVAEQGQARYVTLADRLAGWYTPLVHILAMATFLGWWLGMGEAWQVSLLHASTVLIITCPCALGLAVPVVQVLASGALMRRGIFLKSASALERLAQVNQAVFDKTGTLTVGRPELLQKDAIAPEALRHAASLAAHSKHPLSQALVRAYDGPLQPVVVEEIPGKGLISGVTRLGSAAFCDVGAPPQSATELELWLAEPGRPPVRFGFADQLRPDAAEVIAALQHHHIPSQLLSGDRAVVVEHIATLLGITQAEAGLTPPQKCARLEALKGQGARVLMVGDGLNDAPALASAYVSMSPATAMDITQNAADIVFQGEKLQPVLFAIRIARFAQQLVKQNFALAMLYNVIAVPLAIMGYVTPLIAAAAMSGSSLVVILNALRLNLFARRIA
jgi:Cu2+-exporting ATPase